MQARTRSPNTGGAGRTAGFGSCRSSRCYLGVPICNCSATDGVRAALADYLRRVIDFGAALGARALVFGSPKNRVCAARSTCATRTRSPRRSFASSASTRRLGRVAFCIEANPPEYGCDFVTTTAEAVDLCAMVDHPGIRVNADLGGMTMAGEDPGASIRGRERTRGTRSCERTASRRARRGSRSRRGRGLRCARSATRDGCRWRCGPARRRTRASVERAVRIARGCVVGAERPTAKPKRAADYAESRDEPE